MKRVTSIKTLKEAAEHGPDMTARFALSRLTGHVFPAPEADHLSHRTYECEVLDGLSEEEKQEFAKHIDILNTTLDAKSLAYMIYGFHSGNIETLILEHHDGDEYDPEMNPPEFHKNDDGSASLTYELMSTGRATIVKPFVLTISPDYQITLTRNNKEAPTTP